MNNSGKQGWIYRIKCDKYHKIGFTRNVIQRMNELDKYPWEIDIVSIVYTNNAFKIEQKLHTMFCQYRVRNEWYDFGNVVWKSEQFKCIINHIKEEFSL